MASGIIPQISAILGSCAGIASYSPTLTDFIFMSKKISHMLITGPDLVKTITGRCEDLENLGGAEVHNEISGTAHFMAKNENECLQMIKMLLSFLPQSNMEKAPNVDMMDNIERQNYDLRNIMPQDTEKPYDMKKVIKEVLDVKSFLETQMHFAQNIVVGFGRLNGNSVGIVATQPCESEGCLDIDSSGKISRFVRFCDSFNIPLINFVDSGNFPIGQEHKGVIRQGSKVFYAYSEATVPKISLIIGKAYDGAYIAFASKEMGCDKVIAWPTAEIAVMGAEHAVSIINKKEFINGNNGNLRNERIEEYRIKYLNPYVSAQQGRIDLIIDPKDTRKTLIKCLEILINKREKIPEKKHGNTPM